MVMPGLATVAQAAGPKIALRVLLVTDGGPASEAIGQQLTSEGVPFIKVDLNSGSRPVIDAAFLSSTAGGVTTAKFQGIVLPNENPFGADSAEMTAITAYEKQFGIRQVDAYTWANPAVGLNYAGYVGSLDGITGTATPAATTAEFRYLDGPVPFEDADPNVTESYGYVATPLPDDPATSSHFEPLVTAPIGATGTQGSIVGQYNHDGRSELVVTFVYNNNQKQYRVLAHGMVTWLTKGVHLGYQRNYFALHVDDVFASGGRWSMDANCTPGDGCPLGPDGESTVTTPPIRMNAADVDNAAAWESAKMRSSFSIAPTASPSTSTSTAAAATSTSPRTIPTRCSPRCRRRRTSSAGATTPTPTNSSVASRTSRSSRGSA